MEKWEVEKYFNEMIEKKRQIWDEMSAYKKANPERKETDVLDEEQRVRWNKEEVKRRNLSRKSKIASFTAALNQCNKDITEQIKKYICDNWGFKEQTAEIIYRNAYEKGHAYGYREVLIYVDENADMVNGCLKIEMENKVTV